MKFKEMPYKRPDPDMLKEQIRKRTEALCEAKSYEEARRIFLEYDREDRHIYTLSTLASIRHSIDTRDAFYDAEVKFWNALTPELQEYSQQWLHALLQSPFRGLYFFLGS